MTSNELYLAVLPLIYLGQEFGRTEQVLTLFSDRSFATEFFPDEVEGYIATFENRANKYLTGGHVESYVIKRESTEGDRVIVKVVQNVRG